ncbi:MAG: hypothetical protein ACFFEY_02640 [Candidatus Thorarchaeota archaeon]
MNEIKKIIEDLGIAALENNIKIAGVAVISDSGEILYQTENFDLTNQTSFLSNVMRGESSFTLNGIEFSIVDKTTEGFVGTNRMGLGHVLIVPFQGGVLVSYAMSKAEPIQALYFLKDFAMKLNRLE